MRVPPSPGVHLPISRQAATHTPHTHQGGVLKGSKTFRDVYYDTARTTLARTDNWLRKRAGKWELKAARTKENAAAAAAAAAGGAGGDVDTVDIRNEHDDEAEILSLIVAAAPTELACDGDSSGALDAMLLPHQGGSAKLHVLADFLTERRSYALDGATVDLDRAGRKPPLATKSLLEDTDGLRRPPPSKGGDAIHQCPLDAVALCFLLMCALLMTSSHSEGLVAALCRH